MGKGEIVIIRKEERDDRQPLDKSTNVYVVTLLVGPRMAGFANIEDP